MENTSCESKCPFVKMGLCQTVEECPNFVQSWWHQGQSGEQKLVRDCVPKRLMIQMGLLQARFEGAQVAAEQARNETLLMKEHFIALEAASKAFIEDHDKKNLLE